ncbi:MAG TPA: methylcobamide--CoM methyltransferase MtbA, partial [Thiocapsa sp.]|nr:methylcobamide--CoM methyltransferase MtbA [Thiocapsa sp.]
VSSSTIVSPEHLCRTGLQVAMRTLAAIKGPVAIRFASGHGGGFILSDNHGEIPYQVPEDTLLAISEAVHRWGTYPLDVSREPPSPPLLKDPRS